MELRPQNPNRDGLLAPISIVVVYMQPYTLNPIEPFKEPL